MRPDHVTVNAAREPRRGLCGRAHGADLKRCDQPLLHEGDCSGNLLLRVVEGTYHPPLPRHGVNPNATTEPAGVLIPRRLPLQRTVLGVVLHRVGPDTWAAGEWRFRQAEGESLLGRPEWWAFDAVGVLTVHTSLRGCVIASGLARKADPLSSVEEPAGDAPSAPAGSFLRGVRVGR